MKRACAIVLVLLLCLPVFCHAEMVDLPNMNTSELNRLEKAIQDELDEHHETTSSQRSEVQQAIKDYVESYYGQEHVSWAWLDYSYTREWDFFTMKTNAKITKHDGGKAQYDVYGEAVNASPKYRVVYVMIGTEVILDERDTIEDDRVRAMLGTGASATASVGTGRKQEPAQQEQTPETTTLPEPAKEEEIVIAKKGSRGDTVKSIQEMLIRLTYLTGAADGDFGGKTQQAVEKFQRDNAMTADGIVTQSVWDALKKAYDALPVPVSYPTYTAKQLYAKFEENELAAEAALEGTIIQVTGKVYDISDDLWGDPYVSLYADSYGWETIHCYFARADKDKLTTLKKGRTITILGECGDMGFMSVNMRDCELLQ